MTGATSDRSPVNPRHDDWRPQRPRPMRRQPVITDPLVEPLWTGVRVLVHFRAPEIDGEMPRIELRGEKGNQAGDVAPETVSVLRDSIMAFDAVIDGVLTRQPTAGGVGHAIVAEAESSRLPMVLPGRADATYRRRIGEPGDFAFVAVDLLSIDGQDLLDLPLLERKRLLESLLVQSELVRVSPVARPPIRPWLTSWKAAGLRGVMLKAANSRYRPGDLTSEWSIVEHMTR